MLFNEIYKKIVISRLKNLTYGQITVYDGNRIYQFGSGDPLCTTVRIKDQRFYKYVVFGGSLGCAQAFIQGYWSCSDLTILMRIMLRNRSILDKFENGFSILFAPMRSLLYWLQRNSERGSKKNIRFHYDLGNEFFSTFLDKSLMYSSAIYPSPSASLETAATYKLEYLCKKLQLKASDHILEIGTGWGGFAIYAAQNYGCKVTTTTISKQQYEYVKNKISLLGLSDKITLLDQDYRKLVGKYSKIISIEMIEAVGHNYYPVFFEQCSRLLTDNGILVLQTITILDQHYDRARKEVDFIKKYIFPGSCIPSLTALNSAAVSISDLHIAYVEDIGFHYARTLHDWYNSFIQQTQKIIGMGFSVEFTRMWEFYLNYCEAGFLERFISNQQIIFVKPFCNIQWPVRFSNDLSNATEKVYCDNESTH